MPAPLPPPGVPPGDRFADGDHWVSEDDDTPHLWKTLGYRRTGWAPGSTSIEWDATSAYGFPTAAVTWCTQMVLPDDGAAGRFDPSDAAGAPPEDARG